MNRLDLRTVRSAAKGGLLQNIKSSVFQYIGVRGSRTRYLIPGRDGMGAGLGQRILPSPPPSPSPPRGGLCGILNRLFSDTYKRSRRDTTAKRLVRPLRFFLVFKKSRNFQKRAYTHLKNRCKLQKMFLKKNGLGAPSLEFRWSQ